MLRPTYTGLDTLPLGFRPKIDAAREDADAADMAEGMAGPEPVEEAEPVLCCPKCGTEFPLSEGIPENQPEYGGEPVEEEAEGDFDDFRLR